MFVEFLRLVAQELGYIFQYGRRDFQNLFEAIAEDDPNVYLFLDPVTREPVLSQNTSLPTTYYIFSGNMMLLSKAALDQEYDENTGVRPSSEGKWTQNINPKVQASLGPLLNQIACIKDQRIERWVIRDVVNLFDQNMDGVVIEFRIRYEDRPAA